ncbi:MAG: DUF6266 family protein [Candidatus Pedobacter colombiensis]|uniref:DUF6266 family protein n=1 Tax=Candidatus Pedobacter colombiensis TaxID=3121371 RepID=A0AAJ5W492_9SPHI|nr:DUF6266 family protein [Pedobacter sp.]WEK17784.1 MAG: DUF6266 family protein [Pedobacter sp.]
MGILKNGIMGNYRGRIGNLVFYVLNGKTVVRTIGKTTKPPTELQLKCRQEMSVVSSFLKHITEFINVGFNLMAKYNNKHPFNMALSYNRKYALQGRYPDIGVNFKKVLVTEGSVLNAIDPFIESIPEGLKFSWSCPDSLNWSRPNDNVMLLAYFPVLQKAEYVLYGAKRSAGSDILSLPADLLNEYMEVYISFVAEDRRGIANSTYLGSFND